MPEEIQCTDPLPFAGNDMPLGGMASAPGPMAIWPETGDPGDVPELVRAAGEPAVRAYQEFLDDPRWSPSTRKLYGQRARRFLHWAERLGRTLNSITTADLKSYAAELAAERSKHVAFTYLSPVRSLFGQFARSGVLTIDPCPKGQANGRRKTSMIDGREPGPVGFPLLDLLAMLGNMEQESLRRIFAEEESALFLLDRVRFWPDGPTCPHCGTGAGDDPPGQIVCPACAKPYSVTTGTMFEGSPVPVRHWLFLIHQMYLSEPRLPDDELQRHTGFDMAAISSLIWRIVNAVVNERLPTGDELKQAISVRNKEMIQGDAVRSIIKYAELTGVRDRLVRARDEGTPVADLPPGMSLEEAIEKFEALIAEEDSYLISVEDGYLVRSPADEHAAAGADAVPETAVRQ